MHLHWPRLGVLPSLALETNHQQSGVDVRRILEHISEVVLVIAQDGAIEWASPSTTDHCGWTMAELLTMRWYTLVHPGDIERIRDILTTNQPEYTRLEIRLRCGSDGYRWHRATVNRMGVDPHAASVIELVNIDEEVRIRMHSRQSEISMRRLLDDIPDTVVEWLPIRDGSDRIVDLQVLRGNQAFFNRFGGYSVEGLLASTFSPVAMQQIPNIEAVLRNGGESFHEVVAGDKRYQLHLSATAQHTVIGISRPMGRVGSNSNEEREQQEQLARVAHTLRTNLSVVQGWTELLADSEADYDAAIRRQAVESITRNTTTLLTSVNELLSTTANNGTYHLPVEDTALDPLLQAAIDDLRATHRSTAFELRGETNLLAHTNSSALSTVLQHLLENAARFATSTVAVNVRAENSAVVIEVLDDGPGIAADVELFKAFTPNHHGEGHGVGLNVVHRLVEALDGTIVGGNRTDAQGACFRVTIPQAELSRR